MGGKTIEVAGHMKAPTTNNQKLMVRMLFVRLIDSAKCKKCVTRPDGQNSLYAVSVLE